VSELLHFIAAANISRYRRLLEEEISAERRKLILKLLQEEEAKLESLQRAEEPSATIDHPAISAPTPDRADE
jgi:hypothetical protein